MGIVIDADSHNMPDGFLDDEDARRRFRSRWPRLVADAAGRSWVNFPEREFQLTAHQRTLPSELFAGRRPPGYRDSTVREAWLDDAGIDMQVLVPSPSPYAYAVEPELGLAMAQAFNNALAQQIERHPGRFIGLAVVPMQDVVAAIEELDRAVGELGIHAPLIISNVNGRNLSDYEFWPFYKRVEELGVPLIIHANRFETPGPAGLERLGHMHLDNALGFLFEGTLAITSLIMYGVLDMFPRLKVGVLETGAGYLSYLMDRLQEVYEGEIFGGITPAYDQEVKDLIRKPPEQYMDQLWVCFNVGAERRNVAPQVARFGADRFMVNSDYPHGLGGTGEGMADVVRDLDDLTDGEKDQLLGLAACTLFGIDPTTRKQVRNGVTAASR